MGILASSSDFPLTLVARESEISNASDVAAANQHFRDFLMALVRDGFYCVEIDGEKVILQNPKDVDVAYRLYLASSELEKNARRQQARTFFPNKTLLRQAA